MIILTIRTDKPESEIGLFNDDKKLVYAVWQAHRQLAETIHKKINEVLANQGKKLDDVEGIVCYQSPGSFTGLRIGLTVGDAIAYSLDIPIVGTMETDWVEKGIENLQKSSTPLYLKRTVGSSLPRIFVIAVQ